MYDGICRRGSEAVFRHTVADRGKEGKGGGGREESHKNKITVGGKRTTEKKRKRVKTDEKKLGM
jgi:hypothetical protein